VQHAEDARIITLRRMRQEQAQKERDQMQQQQAEAQARADEAARQQQAAQSRADELARQQQEEAARRSQAEADRQAAEAAKAQADQARADAEAAAQRAQQEREQAEAARQAALQQQQQLQSQAEQAQQRAQQAESEKAQLRERLRQQLNTILATRESAKGLIVNMSDVLFDTGKYTLKPGAREKLAKVAGILLAYPGLKVQIEGFTDNVGGDEYNQRLSEQRAMTVRDYLVQQGINLNNVTAQGFGKGDPVASNATPSGRQQNRRVELVVNGEPIDVNASVNPAGAQPSTPAMGTGEAAPAASTGNNDGTAGNSSLPQSDQGATQPHQGQPASSAAPARTPRTTMQPADNQQPNTAPTVPK
jgi:outer membrane protein OmpA-like peptidoglycan-associated protein